MNLGVISTMRCVNKPPAPDFNCDDPAFALANPDKCPPEQQFIIKPGVVLVCELGSIKFRAFTVINGAETDVTNGALFTSSNTDIVAISSTTGDATGVVAGEAVITATYAGLMAQATMSVLVGEDCCDDQTVAFMVLVDQTKSMQQVFGTGYINKLAYAKAAAIAVIDSINETKDVVGLARFTKDATVVLSTPIADKAAVSALVPTIALTSITTEFYDAIGSAIAALSLVSADRKVLIIISDGEDTAVSYLEENPIELTGAFKSEGGIVICVGVRAHDTGYSLLSAFASGGFFLNAYQGTDQDCLDYLIGLKGYLCAGSCAEDGDDTDYRGTLNYDGLLNWDLIDSDTEGLLKDVLFPDNPAQSGFVDLLGNGFFDFLPGNGLYIDMLSGSGTTGDTNPLIVSKSKFALTDGETYRIGAVFSRNQIQSGFGQISFSVQIIGETSGVILSDTAIALEYAFGKLNVGFTFTAPANEDARIVLWQNNTTASVPSTTGLSGLLLLEVEFRNTTTGDLLLFDNFDTENPTYVGPKCGISGYVEDGIDTTKLTVTGVWESIAFSSNCNAGDYPGGDDPTHTCSHNFGVGVPGYNRIHFTNPEIITRVYGDIYKLIWAQPITVEIQGSNDGTIWTTLHTDYWTLPMAFTVSYDFSFVNATPYSYYQIKVTPDSYAGGGSYVFQSTTYSNGSNASAVGEYTQVSPTLYQQVGGDCTIELIAGVWHMTDPVGMVDFHVCNEADFPVGPWTGGAVDSTSVAYHSTFGYGYGYDCYGEGCLEEPPISQKQDPNPLPNLEVKTVGGSFTSTQQGCAPSCQPGFVDIGQPLTATQLVLGDDEYVTTIALPSAAKVKRWEVTFNREWNLDTPGLTFEGSNGAAWIELDVQSTVLNSSAGTVLRYTLAAESAAYQFFRVFSSGGNPTGDEKVFKLQVYPTPENPVCATGIANGATKPQAIANAIQAAIDAAKLKQNCIETFAASEVYTAPTGESGAASASSLNSMSEAQTIAAAAAQAAAVP